MKVVVLQVDVNYAKSDSTPSGAPLLPEAFARSRMACEPPSPSTCRAQRRYMSRDVLSRHSPFAETRLTTLPILCLDLCHRMSVSPLQQRITSAVVTTPPDGSDSHVVGESSPDPNRNS